MQIPGLLPGLKLATLLTGLYGLAWIALEGSMPRVIALGFLVTAVALGHGISRVLGDRHVARGVWVAVLGLVGLLAGAGTVLITFGLMALKTGLHAHGPEFSREELGWLLRQWPLWSMAGCLAGVGLGLITAAIARHEADT